MLVSINGPNWFYTTDAIFQILFAFVALAVMFFSYKAYSLTREKKYGYFSLSFLLISLGFFTISFSNLLVYKGVYDGVISRLNEFNLSNAFYLAHIFFMLLGYTVLLLLSMKVKSKRMVALTLAFMLLFIAFSYQYYLKFHMVSFILMCFISWQLYENYIEKKTLNTLLVFSSFFTLSFAELFFLATVYYASWFYVVAHLLQLAGFGLIFCMIMKVLYGGKKE